MIFSLKPPHRTALAFSGLARNPCVLARSWLLPALGTYSGAPAVLQFLLLVRSLELNGADARLLRDADFQRNSARSLRSLVNVGPQALPLLPRFANLQQVGALHGFVGGR